MEQRYPNFELYNWNLKNAGSYKISLSGSAASPVSIADLIALSTDPTTTRANLSFDNLSLDLGGPVGNATLRETIARELYDASKVKLTGENVVITNATTGANLLALSALLQRGDHAISLYPTYAQLGQWPAIMGVEVSHWHLHPDRDWTLDINDLKRMIRPGETKAIVLNNPHNPTGSIISTAQQRTIVEVAKEFGLTIVCDEIFRPLFHDTALARDPPTSLLEHAQSSGYDRIVVTGSLSKPYGLSGVRIGWAVTASPAVRDLLVSMRAWTISSVSVVDEAIAAETLSTRCRRALLDKTLATAETNLALLRKTIATFPERLECLIPPAAGTAFLKILDRKGEAMDDVVFCHALRDQEGVLLAPGSLTFGGEGREGDFKGFVRVHITAPVEKFVAGMEGLGRFLEKNEGAGGTKGKL